MAKQKKEKVRYVDDGRTIADMSALTGNRLNRDSGRPLSTAKDKWNTYWAAVKMMLTPMLCVIVALGVIYMVLYAIFFFMY